MNWAPDFTLDNAKQAVLAFKGDVYTGPACRHPEHAGAGFCAEASAHFKWALRPAPAA